MIDIVMATRNPKKFQELKALLTVPGIRWHSVASGARVPVVPEKGRTFAANAITKARAVARATRCVALADDSGLEVEALQGAPGVRSARFAGRHGNDHANNATLLARLNGLPLGKRRARFRCVLALASPARLLATTEGTFIGRIATTPKGRRGFGYDPIFFVPRFCKTVAQLPTTLKHRISHRAKAAQRMRPILARLAQRAAATAATRRGAPIPPAALGSRVARG